MVCPLFRGVVILCDAGNGRVLAVIDSMEITLIRTGAATGVAARHLANKDSSVVTICGCGNQGRISLKALMHTHPVKQVYAYDADRAIAENYARDMAASFNVTVEPVADLHTGARRSDICVTCTPSKKPLLFKNDVREGTFIAAVGADSDDKVEIDPHLIASARLIADITEQSAAIGDFHYALEQGCVGLSHVQAELGDVIAGKKPGRTLRKEVVVFDSTGTALQDVAAAAIVYEKALAKGIGTSFNFGKPL
ncbi:MAG: ornithine cyclodeaminase family protein [Bacteroidia bacterium]|nr:ornithine cyclodeaminase family protein [Bacteroidia bacterium]